MFIQYKHTYCCLIVLKLYQFLFNFNEHSSGTITGLNIADNTGITLDGVNDYIISDPITYTKSLKGASKTKTTELSLM